MRVIELARLIFSYPTQVNLRGKKVANLILPNEHQ